MGGWVDGWMESRGSMESMGSRGSRGSKGRVKSRGQGMMDHSLGFHVVFFFLGIFLDFLDVEAEAEAEEEVFLFMETREVKIIR